MIVGPACPFCKLMFEDGTGNIGVVEAVTPKDIAQLVAEALGGYS